MTQEHSKHFANDKSAKTRFHGHASTHYTSESMLYCTSISGSFETDAISAAKASFNESYYDNSECYELEYVDGSELIAGNAVKILVYGLVHESGRYYWNGETYEVELKLEASVKKC